MSVKKILYQSVVWRGLFYLTVFLLNILIARNYGAKQSGEVYYLVNIFSLILLFTGLSLESGITYFTAKNSIEPRKLLGFSIGWAVCTGILSWCVFYFFLQPYYRLPGDVLMFAVFAFIVGNHLLVYSTAFFYAQNNFIFPNAVNVFINLLLMVILPYNGVSILPFVTTDSYFYYYFGSYLLAGILLALAVKLRYIKKSGVLLLSFGEFKQLFGYCMMAYFSNIVFFFLYRIDYWFVEHYCSGEALGNYIQVSKIGQLFFVLPTILASVVFPLTASGNNEQIKGMLTMLSRSLLWLYGGVCVLLIITGKSLFPLVFGKEFEQMYPSFLFLIPGILSLSMLFTLTAFYAGKNKIGVNIKGALIALCVVITGDFLLIPAYGINAASFVSSVGYFIYLIVVLRIFIKEYQVPLSSFFVIKKSDFNSIWQNIVQKINPADDNR